MRLLPAEPARLEFDHVTVAYNGKAVLEDILFDVPHGAQVAVVGPNGAGKSTLFKALVGLLPLRTGQIRIHDLPLGQHQGCVAYVPQREEVDWRFPVTVQDVVTMGRLGKSGWFGHYTPTDRQMVAQSLEELGIANLSRRAIGELSSVIGLYLSYYLNVASGAAIVLTSTAFFLLAFFFAPGRGLAWRLRRSSP